MPSFRAIASKLTSAAKTSFKLNFAAERAEGQCRRAVSKVNVYVTYVTYAPCVT